MDFETGIHRMRARRPREHVCHQGVPPLPSQCCMMLPTGCSHRSQRLSLVGSSYCFFEHGGKLKSSIVADMARPLGIHNAHSGYPITEGKYLYPLGHYLQIIHAAPARECAPP